jgi:ectoine hydroxylase-related dioxygenase (phytanoyl-CoA dioxygenase family)
MTETTTGQTARAHFDAEHIESLVDTLRTDGVIGIKGAFDREWVEKLDEDVATAFAEARTRERGAVGRGPNRWYVEIHPQQIRGFVDLATHPWITAVAERVLGPDYEIVEVGFDIPFSGAVNQPWHRDFPSPVETYERHMLTSLAVNVTTVDTEPDMGPFEIAPGTQYDRADGFEHEMFPAKSRYPRYEERAVRKFPQRGDISIRSALTIHRGTKNLSEKKRPVLVFGLDAPGAGNAAHHDLAVTTDYWASLPDELRRHLHCPVVDELTPITQKHTIEGLVMGEA